MAVVEGKTKAHTKSPASGTLNQGYQAATEAASLVFGFILGYTQSTEKSFGTIFISKSWL